jgi:UDP-3-O-[3-hydroxymyristoyl] glucosamine N-acyltransferase
MKEKTLSELAQYVDGQIKGDPEVVIKSASTLNKAGEGDISFLVNDKYEKQLETTKASAVIVSKDIITKAQVPLLLCEDPYYAFMQIMVLLHGHRKHRKTGISPQACISDKAHIGSDCHIHQFTTIEDGAHINNGCIIYPGCYIGKNVHLGNDCIIYPNVTIYEGCKLGKRVIINASSVIGEDGFGYAPHKGVNHKIPQVGAVMIEDDVELGCGCAIERGTLGDTVICQDTKLGDMVTVGHGSKIGPHCLLVAQVGIAGSTNIGHHCVMGGQVGIVGHINIGNCVQIGAQAGVINSVGDNKTILGAPAIDANIGRRAYSMIQYLPDMRKNIKKLKRQIEELEAAVWEEENSS